MLNIYGKYAPALDRILNQLLNRFDELNKNYEQVHHERLYEHLRGRVKSEASMEQKCKRKNLPLTPRSALRDNRDSIGLRVICNFIDDIYMLTVMYPVIISLKFSLGQLQWIRGQVWNMK